METTISEVLHSYGAGQKSRSCAGNTLLYALGKEVEQVFNTFMFGEEEKDDDYETVLNKLNHYFSPKVNVIHE